MSLALGYMWDADLRQVNDAVVSFRDGADKPVWAVTVRKDTASAAAIVWSPVDSTAPEFDLSQVLDVPSDGEEGATS